MMHRFTILFAHITFLVMLVAAGFYLYWSLQSSSILSFKNAPIPVRPSEIHPEATVILHYDYCKKSDIHGKVTAAIVSNFTKVLIPDMDEITPKMCKVIDVPVIIPGQTPDGTYHLEYTATYVINPLKTSIITWRSQDFKIVNIPPLPVAPTVNATTDTTITPTQTVITTNDGSGNTTSTTTNNPAPKATPTRKPIAQAICKVLSSVGLCKP